ncbi:MAG: pilus assembly protein PilM [Candidatus Omnitrophota bacterium]
MKQKKVGLYLGTNSVGAVMVQGKDLISLARFELSSVEESKREAANEEIRWEALINKTLRELGSEAKNIYLSVADRDFIFRPLDMPIMRKKEVESSLVYEIEKYIPFKIEELVWDYDCITFSKERKMGIAFVGIRETNFQRFESILSRLELRPVALEPCCLSLVRIIKSLKRFARLKDFALLDFAQSEAYLTFFQGDLPVFNRYLVVPKKENSLDLDEFIDAVNFSFQYFKREFRNYRLEKLIVIGDPDLERLTSPLKDGLHIEIDTMSPYDLTARNNARIENVKALGALDTIRSTYKFKPQLKKTVEPLSSSPERPKEVALKVGLLSTLTGVGLIVVIVLSVMLANNIFNKKLSLKRKEESMSLPNILAELSWPEREDRTNLEEEHINSLRKLRTSLIRFSSFFEMLASTDALPYRLWLESLTINPRDEGYRAVLSGRIFRNDSYEERQGIDDLVASLRENATVRSIFSKIELDSLNRDQEDGFEFTVFSVNLEK